MSRNIPIRPGWMQAAVLLLVSVCGAGPAAAQSATTRPATARDSKFATLPKPPAPDPRKAKLAFEKGQRAEREGDWQIAFVSYSEASTYAPENSEYHLRRDLVRSRLVQDHANRAERDAVGGNLDDARRELQAALDLDPTDSVVRERLEQLRVPSAASLREVPERLSSEIRLLPAPGVRDFDYRGDSLGAYAEVARQFGLNTAFDVDLQARPVRLQVSRVDFYTAMRLLGDMTLTFWRPLTARMFFVAADTPEKRKEYDASVLRSVVLPDSATPDQMTEMLRVVREIVGINRADLDVRSRTITMRDSPQQIALAIKLLLELEKPPAEMILDIEILEVNRDAARNLGITPPEQGRVITLSRQDLLEAQQSAQGLVDVLTRLFGQPSSLSGLGASQIASLIGAGQFNINSLIPPLLAFGGGRTTFLATLPGAVANFSDTLSLVRQGRRILLRAEDGRPATFFVGDRIPITLATFSASLAPPPITTNVASTTFPRTDFVVGNKPVSLVVADFNEDGHPDIAVVNQMDDSISILLGNGDGTFKTPTTIGLPAGSNPAAIVAADFNADKHIDLAIADQASDHISILLGKGDGTFQPEAHFVLPAGSGPTSLITADFNNDSKPDLAVVDTSANNIAILLGNGDGTFTLKSSPVTGNRPVALSAADFNRDGRQDLAVVNQQSNSVSTLLGNGDGTFQPITTATTFATGNTPTSVVTADFNGDSIPDLAVTNFTDNTVSVFLGKGDGTLSTPATFATGVGPSFITSADFNFDSRPDIAVANQTDSTVSVLLGNGDGSFAARLDLPVGVAPVDVAAADLNGDNRPDLLTANSTGNSVTVILNSAVFTPSNVNPQTLFPNSEYLDIGLKVKATPRVHLDGEVTLQMHFEISSLSGVAVNSIPIISNRTIEQTIRLREDETSALAGILQHNESVNINGTPGANGLGGIGALVSNQNREVTDTELLVLVTPRMVRQAPHAEQAAASVPGSAKPSNTTPAARP